MKIMTLIEDTNGASPVHAEHGLSFYIETERHKLLMDTGASEKTWENAAYLGIDPGNVDTVILSHGHYDHTGGLLSFAKQNHTAEIYLQRAAFGAFYHGDRYIGMDPAIQSLPHLHAIEGNFRIDPELSLFSGINGRRLWPEGNRVLSQNINGTSVQDTFSHEQCLVVEEDGKTTLLSGCAHNGILNILDRYHELYGGWPDAVVSGFHMMKKTPYSEADRDAVRETARELAGLPTRFYTGHCTGDEAFSVLKEEMGTRIFRLHAGERIF